MLRFFNEEALNEYPILRDSMYKDRARQFADRLGWPVSVSKLGHERDEYDVLSPTYGIWINADGTHGGSLRLLSGQGRTMVAEKFPHLLARPVLDDRTWECSRFCKAPNAPGAVTIELLNGLKRHAQFHGIYRVVGVFYRFMLRIYRKSNWIPKVIGQSNSGKRAICAGIWDVPLA